MKIGLYNLEPKIVNTAMMQVSKYHKEQGDTIEKYNMLFNKEYDKIYAFSIFEFTDKGYIRPNMIVGGTGFDIKTKLPKEIEACDYDWDLYPNCDYSILRFSRGCNYNHGFCVVPQKEGKIKSVDPKNLNPNGTHIKIYDNNFFQNPKWKKAIKYLKKLNQPVVFDGVDIRYLNQEKCEALLSLKHKSQIHIAWDNPKEKIDKHIEKALQWIKPYRLMCYVLIGYDSTELGDLHRVETLRRLKVDPFVMPYNKFDTYQRNFARYVNCKEIFKSVSWKDYNKTGGIND